jgi:hypothetical protein
VSAAGSLGAEAEPHHEIADAPLMHGASAALSPLHAGPQSPTHDRVRAISPAPQVALHAPHALQADQVRGLPAQGGEPVTQKASS